MRLCVKARNRTGDVRYLLSSVSPEAHSVGEVGLQLGAITTALNSVQDLQTAEEDPTVQSPLENRHLLNNSSNQSCAQMQILHVYNKSTTCTDLPVYYVHLSCNCYTTASHPVMERGHQWTTAGQMWHGWRTIFSTLTWDTPSLLAAYFGSIDCSQPNSESDCAFIKKKSI